MHNDKVVGYIIPVAGQLHQNYLLHHFNSLSVNSKRIITFGIHKSGWLQNEKEIILLKKTSLIFRLANKINQKIEKVSNKLGYGNLLIPRLPNEWKQLFIPSLSQNNIGVLIVNFGGCGMAMIDELERVKIPIIIVFHGSDVQMAKNNSCHLELLKRLWKRADKCVYISNFLLEQALKAGGPEKKSMQLYLGHKLSTYNIFPKKFTPVIHFVCTANLHPVKGHKYLLEAFALLTHKLINIKLTLIGDGPLRKELTHLVHNLKIESFVTFLGVLPWDQTLKFLTTCDIYMQPSVRAEDGQEEGLSLGVIEAQSLGLPAIVFKSGGLPETIEDRLTGRTCAERDVVGLSAAMHELAVDTALRENMSVNARKFIREKFDLKITSQQWNKVIKQLLQI